MSDGLTGSQREYFRILEALEPSDDLRRSITRAKADLAHRARGREAMRQAFGWYYGDSDAPSARPCPGPTMGSSSAPAAVPTSCGGMVGNSMGGGLTEPRRAGAARWRGIVDVLVMLLLFVVTLGACLSLVALGGGAINAWSIGLSLLVTLFVLAQGLGLARR